MEIKAADVKALRVKTGAGMLDCKNALVKANGDAAKAEKMLKEMGLAAAAKRSGKATNEGRVFSVVQNGKAGLLELSCETDFVARNKEFIEMGENLLETAIKNNLSEVNDELNSIVDDTKSKIKENISLKRFRMLEIADNELAADYIHGEGKIGVIVKAQVESSELKENETVRNFVFDCALHVAAFNPLYMTRDSVDPSYLQEQEDIFTKQAEKLGKPANVATGIVKGKLNKHLSEIVFLDQGFVKEEKQSVAKMTESIAKEVGGSVKLVDFMYYRVGE